MPSHPQPRPRHARLTNGLTRLTTLSAKRPGMRMRTAPHLGQRGSFSIRSDAIIKHLFHERKLIVTPASWALNTLIGVSTTTENTSAPNASNSSVQKATMSSQASSTPNRAFKTLIGSSQVMCYPRITGLNILRYRREYFQHQIFGASILLVRTLFHSQGQTFFAAFWVIFYLRDCKNYKG